MQFAGASILIQLPPGANAHKTGQPGKQTQTGTFEPPTVGIRARKYSLGAAGLSDQFGQ